MNSTTVTRLESFRDQETKLTADQAAERNGIIAREIHAGTDKGKLAQVTGMSVPNLNKIARTTPDAPADDVVTGGSTVVVDGTIVAQTRNVDAAPAKAPKAKAAPKDKPAPKAKAPAADGPRRVFQPAPAGGHVPPRSRKIRGTGSVVSFGHASEMGYPKTPVAAHIWVSRCDTHSTPDAAVDATFDTRSEARYQDGTEYCLECAALAG